MEYALILCFSVWRWYWFPSSYFDLSHLHSTCSMWLSASHTDNLLHYINTSEIAGELSHEDTISSHVKITGYLHIWRDHCCYGYIINCTLCGKKNYIKGEMVWYFIGVSIINRTLLTWPLGDTKFFVLC